MGPILETSRLLLREWDEKDLEEFILLNADPRVMEFFPSVKSREESMAEYGRIQAHFQRCGWGFWAVSVKGGARFIGFIGLAQVLLDAPFTPAVEIGWRLTYDSWGKGYATEGAKAALSYGFHRLALQEIVSFTAVQNLRSRAVMERLGMRHDAGGDFDHPRLAEGHRLRRHVLYRISAEQFRE